MSLARQRWPQLNKTTAAGSISSARKNIDTAAQALVRKRAAEAAERARGFGTEKKGRREAGPSLYRACCA